MNPRSTDYLADALTTTPSRMRNPHRLKKTSKIIFSHYAWNGDKKNDKLYSDRIGLNI